MNWLTVILSAAAVSGLKLAAANKVRYNLAHTANLAPPPSAAAGFLAKLRRLDVQDAARPDKATHHVRRHFSPKKRRGRQLPRVHSGSGTAIALSASREQRPSSEPRVASVSQAVNRTGMNHKGMVVKSPQAEPSSPGNDEILPAEVMQEADEHLLEGNNLRHTIAITQATIRDQGRMKGELEAQQGSLEKGRDDLTKTLRKIMEPKLKAARGRLQRDEGALKKLEQGITDMNATREKEEEAASQNVKDAESAFEELQGADAALAEAKVREVKASTKYAALRASGEAAANALHDDEVRYNGSMSRTLRMRRRVEDQTKSVKHVEAILKAEEGKVKLSYDRGEMTLRQKLKGLDEAKRNATDTLQDTKKKYDAWQAAANNKTRMDAERNAENTEAAEAQREKQRETWEAEQAQQVKVAERKNAWEIGDDWAWGGPDGEEIDLNASGVPAPAAASTANESAGSADSGDRADSADSGGDTTSSADLNVDPPDVDANGTNAESASGDSEAAKEDTDATEPAKKINSSASDSEASEEDTAAEQAKRKDSQKDKEGDLDELDAFDRDYIKDENPEKAKPSKDVDAEEEETEETRVNWKKQPWDEGREGEGGEGEGGAAGEGEEAMAEQEEEKEKEESGEKLERGEGESEGESSKRSNVESESGGKTGSSDDGDAAEEGGEKTERGEGEGEGESESTRRSDVGSESGGKAKSSEDENAEGDRTEDTRVNWKTQPWKKEHEAKESDPIVSVSAVDDYVQDENNNTADRAWFEKGIPDEEDVELEGDGEGDDISPAKKT